MSIVIEPSEGRLIRVEKIKPVKNACGVGYRVEDKLGRVMFYKTNEITTIYKEK